MKPCLGLVALLSHATASRLGPHRSSEHQFHYERSEMASLADSLLSVAGDSAPYVTNIKRATDEINNVENSFVHPESTPNKAATVCKIAHAVVGEDRIILPQSSGYQDAQTGFWSQICEKPAACFVKPKNTLEVALAMKILIATKTKFSIRSGGHMPNPGWNGVGEDGAVIDLGLLNSLEFNAEDNTVAAGPGARWQEVQQYLEPFERMAVGGRVAGIGVAGFVAGGGMSHFVNYFGMACDQVKNFEVVLSDSRIVNANKDENADLFKALKGGSANFGIITRLDLYTHPDYQMWQRIYIYSHEDTDKVAKAVEYVHRAMETNDRLGMTFRMMPESYMAIIWHRGWVSETPADFEKAFEGITPSEIFQEGTNMTTYQVVTAFDLPRARTAFGGITVAKDEATYAEQFRWIVDNVNGLPVRVDFSIQPMVKRHVDKGIEMGGNVMGAAPASESMLGWVATWSDAEQDAAAFEMLPKLEKELTDISKKMGTHRDWIFMNDAWVDQDVLKNYGPENVEHMRSVSKAYDPDQVFQKLQNNGFLLSRSNAT